jgi:hypothetical protein
MLAAACGNSTNVASSSNDDDRCQGVHWVGAWMEAPQATSLFSLSGLGLDQLEADIDSGKDIPPNLAQAQVFNDQTLRLIVAPHLGGSSLRLHFSNRFSSGTLELDGVYVGLAATNAALVPGSNRAVTFGGAASVNISPGTEAVSDPVELSTQAFQDLAISFHVAGALVPLDYHLTAMQISYLSALPGSYGANEDGLPFSTSISSWYALDSIDVVAPAATGAVVAFGDSITDGYQSDYNANARWPDDLARRLLAGSIPLSVLDAGISGNYVASDNYIFGPSGASRFAADALSKAGVTDVILLEGINDIGGAPDNPATATAVIDADKKIIEEARAAGLNIIGATLTPAEGSKLSQDGAPGRGADLAPDHQHLDSHRRRLRCCGGLRCGGTRSGQSRPHRPPIRCGRQPPLQRCRLCGPGKRHRPVHIERHGLPMMYGAGTISGHRIPGICLA